MLDVIVSFCQGIFTRTASLNEATLLETGKVRQGRVRDIGRSDRQALCAPNYRTPYCTRPRRVKIDIQESYELLPRR